MTFTFFWFWLAAAALERGAAVSPPAPALHAVIADASGTWAAAALPLSDAVRSRAKTVWVWAEDVPPRRYDIAALPREEAALLSDLRKNPGRVVQARVRGWERPDDLAGMRALVAPEEMWLTVPEELLPSYPLTSQGVAALPMLGRNRVRILGKGLGSSWIRATSPADVAEVMLRRTTDAELSLRFGEGLPVSRAFATAMIASRGAARLEQQAQFVSDRDGRIRISSLPEADVLTLVVTAEGAAPRTVSGTPAELTRALTLSAAGEIAGRFVDERGSALSGVRLEAEAWIAQSVPAIAAAGAVSDDRGRWVLRGLPRNR
ncbi:MAG TPA: hypothetical protein VFO89_17590, partial [Thermoanaerobaculia bacterium]|nr:hypothetical protein [Thermoanaerobaculia bacterium]